MQTLRVYPEGIRVAIDSGVGYEIGQWRLGEAAESLSSGGQVAQSA
jgi:hypothetical protein